MGDHSNFTLHRYNRITDPAAHSPRAALEAALAAYDELDPAERPTHIIVLTGRDLDDGGSGTRYFQAGSYRHHAQMGLLHEGAQMIRESSG